MINHFKLPFQFEPARLKQDLDRISPDQWIPHFNKNQYKGTWSVVSLRSVDGRPDHIYSDPGARNRYGDTAVLSECPYFHEVMDTFKCPKLSVRLLRLSANSEILEHRDYNLDYEDGEIRIHVPVQTNPDLEFYLESKRIRMLAGESWYLNFTLPHRISNKGKTDRVHLVMDCVVNEWVHGMFKDVGYQPEDNEGIDRNIKNLSPKEFESMIQELRRLNTPEANRLADQIEKSKQI